MTTLKMHRSETTKPIPFVLNFFLVSFNFCVFCLSCCFLPCPSQPSRELVEQWDPPDGAYELCHSAQIPSLLPSELPSSSTSTPAALELVAANAEQAELAVPSLMTDIPGTMAAKSSERGASSRCSSLSVESATCAELKDEAETGQIAHPGRKARSLGAVCSAHSNFYVGLQVGHNVEVAGRFWSGLNKEGGPGRITAIHDDGIPPQ